MKALMTWRPKEGRWVKVHGGRSYYVSAAELGCPSSKSGSMAAANEWWVAKRAEIAASVRIRWDDRYSSVLQTLGELSTAAANYGRDNPADVRTAVLYKLLRGLEADVVRHRAGDQAPPSEFSYDMPIDQPWNEPEPTGEGDALEAYIAKRRNDLKAGEIAPSRFAPLAGHVRAFASWLKDRGRRFESLDGALWEQWADHCRNLVAGGSLSAVYARGRFSDAKAAVTWAVGVGRIESEPRNFRTAKPPRLTARDVTTIPIAELKAIIDAAPDRLKLWLMLMANTGAQQKDVSDMRRNEFDADTGTLRRKRSKTVRYQGAPHVTYRLWPCVVELLRKYAATVGDRLLLNENGTALVAVTIDEPTGRLKKSDAIKNAYFRLSQKLDKDLPPLKLLRKSSASFVADTSGNPSLAQWFLGHAGSGSVADRHYLAVNTVRLAEATDALGRALGAFGPPTMMASEGSGSHSSDQESPRESQSTRGGMSHELVCQKYSSKKT